MYFAVVIFSALAVLCVIAGAVAMKRRRDYGNSESTDDGFDFDEYEGFDK
jgi:hypothetical protein